MICIEPGEQSSPGVSDVYVVGRIDVLVADGVVYDLIQIRTMI